MTEERVGEDISDVEPVLEGVEEVGAPVEPSALGPLMARSSIGGVLMGLANLVPGISGGTMLLASGVYTHFIEAIAEISTFRFRFRSLVVLGVVVVAATAAIVLFAGAIKGAVENHRWIMYSVFIGLTLGGAPLVWRMARPVDGRVWIGAVAGFIAMSALAIAQTSGSDAVGEESAGFMMMMLAGVAGASAMILPGVSGAYLLLVLGVYLPILGGLHALKEALQAGDMAALTDPILQVVLPVGVGVVVGVVAVSNLLKWLLLHYEKATLGFLLGLLIGAVVGLWPFQQAVPPEPGDIVRGRTLTAEDIAELDPSKYPTRFFRPTIGQVGGAGALVLLGVSATVAIGRIGGHGGNVADGA